MANSSLQLTSLDFDTLKTDFINFLKTQNQYKDFNFEGSNLNVFLDIMSYNTFKNSFFLNMVASEGFLDSAQMRESLFSHSKELNYIPRSARSATVDLDVSFTANGASQPYIFKKGQTFSTIIKSGSYFFSVSEDTAVTSTNTSFDITLTLYEGTYVSDTYIMDYTNATPRFKLTNLNVDTDSLVVLVYENGSTDPTIFRQASTLLDLNETSEVYFLQGSENADYEVVFGDSVLGRRPTNLSTIVLDYRVTSGDVANGAKTFSIDFDPANGEAQNSIQVATGVASRNGALAETNDSIKFYAPRHFQTQERAITTTDYEILLKSQFPEIAAISVYGGETVIPPRYGKVFVAIDLQNIDGLPDSKRLEYYSFLKSRSPLTVEPIFVEPEFTYIDVVSLVNYNINITTQTSQNLQVSLINTILAFATTYLNDFSATMRYSKFLAAIDGTDPSIVGNETQVRVYKKLQPVLGTPQNINVNFDFPLQSIQPIGTDRHLSSVEQTITTSPFQKNGDTMLIEDDGLGNLYYIKRVGLYDVPISVAGNYDVVTGEISLINFQIDSYDGSSLNLYAKPAEDDISSSKNTILAIEAPGIAITVGTVRE